MNATWPPSLAGNSGGTGGNSRQAGECHVGGRGLRRPLICGFTQYRRTWSQPCRQATAPRGARCFAPPPECLHVERLDVCAKMRVRRREQTCKCVQIVIMTRSAFRSIAKFRSVQRVICHLLPTWSGACRCPSFARYAPPVVHVIYCSRSFHLMIALFPAHSVPLARLAHHEPLHCNVLSEVDVSCRCLL